MQENEIDPFEHYIAIGAIEVEGVSEDGEFLYKVSENAKDIAPELWEIHCAAVEDMVISMIKDDLVDIEYDEELNATIKVSEKGIDVLRENGYDV